MDRQKTWPTLLASGVIVVALAACGGRMDAITDDGANGAIGNHGSATGSGGSSDSGGGSGSSGGGSSGGDSGGPESAPSSSGSGSSSGNASSSGAGSLCSQRSAGGAPPSCASGGPGLTDCGACSESCCTSLEVTGGSYHRTYANSGKGATGLADPATVSSFRLDKYLVTVGRFRQFVSAWNGGAGWTPTAGSGKHTHLNGGKGLADTGGAQVYEDGWIAAYDANVAPTDANLSSDFIFSTWTASAGDGENRPINGITWEEAYAFCIWDGGFLPSEAEWEYAAAGGSQQREYPWGNTDPGTSSQYALYLCFYPDGVSQSVSAISGEPSGACFQGMNMGVLNIPPVGIATLGAGLWGQLDLAGEVVEWTLDLYATYANPCVDCVDATGGYYRAMRTGSFGDDKTNLVPWYRYQSVSYVRNSNFGFRCARTP